MAAPLPGLTQALERMFNKIAAWFAKKKKERAEAVMFERAIVVTFDRDRISATYPDGKIEAVAWKDVQCVAIETNDSGPWGADVWWLLEGAHDRCVYPQGATGEPEVLPELQSRFPGFSDQAVIAAMGCTSNARFVCWESSHAL
ncbi:hypothetical protein [Dokdonella sp.]|uniref:hypothetical protein n=1 Tax=Dokdonella sp. TaxID=2291710 RepID=UPI002DD68E71|nr:hypothetical protein [Dokdonella sp.]